MGTAINGISDRLRQEHGRDRRRRALRLATALGTDERLVELPRSQKIHTEYAEKINHAIAATPNSNLMIAVPTMSLLRSVKAGDNSVENVFILGTTTDYTSISTLDCSEGRFFNELESRGGAECLRRRL